MKLMLMTPAPHMGTGLCPSCSAPHPASCNILGKATADGLSVWARAPTWEAVVTILGVNHQMEDLSLPPSLALTFKYIFRKKKISYRIRFILRKQKIILVMWCPEWFFTFLLLPIVLEIPLKSRDEAVVGRRVSGARTGAVVREITPVSFFVLWFFAAYLELTRICSAFDH